MQLLSILMKDREIYIDTKFSELSLSMLVGCVCIHATSHKCLITELYSESKTNSPAPGSSEV